MQVKYESGPYVVVQEQDDVRQVLELARESGAVGTFDGVVCYRLMFVGKDTYPRQYPESEVQPETDEIPDAIRGLPGIFGLYPII